VTSTTGNSIVTMSSVSVGVSRSSTFEDARREEQPLGDRSAGTAVALKVARRMALWSVASPSTPAAGLRRTTIRDCRLQAVSGSSRVMVILKSSSGSNGTGPTMQFPFVVASIAMTVHS